MRMKSGSILQRKENYLPWAILNYLDGTIKEGTVHGKIRKETDEGTDKPMITV